MRLVGSLKMQKERLQRQLACSGSFYCFKTLFHFFPSQKLRMSESKIDDAKYAAKVHEPNTLLIPPSHISVTFYPF